MANGGIIGPVKVVCTPSSSTHDFTSSGTFKKKNWHIDKDPLHKIIKVIK